MKKMLNGLIQFGTVVGTVSFLAILTMASLAQAKVSDFGDLIQENIAAQKELHGEVKKQMNVARESLNPGPATTMVVESDQTQINTPTSKNFLRYKKETTAKSVSTKKQMDRVSQEFHDANSSF
jgi:hypothetical protein